MGIVFPKKALFMCLFSFQAAARQSFRSILSANRTTFAVWMPKKMYRISVCFVRALTLSDYSAKVIKIVLRKSNVEHYFSQISHFWHAYLFCDSSKFGSQRLIGGIFSSSQRHKIHITLANISLESFPHFPTVPMISICFIFCIELSCL